MYRPMTVLSALLVLAALGSVSPAVAQARFCLQGHGWGYPGNCRFATYHQCRAAASGTGNFCGKNPHYAFARQRSRHY
jgi:hypothetical protein